MRSLVRIRSLYMCAVGSIVASMSLLGSDASAIAGTSYTWNPTGGSTTLNWNDTTATGWNTGAGFPGSGGDLTIGAVENDVAVMYSKNITGNQTIRLSGVNAFLSELDIGDSQ